MTLVETRHGEAVVVQARLPGRGLASIGVLLLDPAAGELWLRFRRDFERIADETDAEILAGLQADLELKAGELGAAELLEWLESNCSNFLEVSGREQVLLSEPSAALDRLYRKHVPAEVLAFRTHLPRYALRAAAGRFGEQHEVEPDGWEEAPEGLRLDEDMFIAQVVGHSMEPRIPDGSFCIFRANIVGSRQGKLVLVENYAESEHGGRYTVKRYRSEKVPAGDGEWRHRKVVLEPLNPDYQPWELEEGSECRILAQFVQVL